MDLKSALKEQTTGIATTASEPSIAETLSDLSADMETKRTRPRAFVASVVSLSADHAMASVKLCTGSIIDVPLSVLKKVKHLGTVSTDEECLGLAVGEIDASTAVGKLIEQMARELERLSRSLDSARDGAPVTGAHVGEEPTPPEVASNANPSQTIAPFNSVLPPITVKIQVNGIAGNPYRPGVVVYQAPPYQYFSEWEVLALQNCFFKSPPIQVDSPVGHELHFFPEAAHGTLLGTPYSATITLYVVLVQRTT